MNIPNTDTGFVKKLDKNMVFSGFGLCFLLYHPSLIRISCL